MTRIFLSHSSKDNAEAIALRQWLIEQDPSLAEDIFLDLTRETGIPAGVRWKDALVRANERCEAVICLLSADWLASRECAVEYRTAENLGKRIFSARLEPLTDTDITREWQRCDLFGDGPRTEIAVAGHSPVTFRTEGLHRLLDGLRTAGLGAQHFPWPPSNDPQRSPYRGWQPFEAVDAAVYFGRDVQIVRAMDMLRGMRAGARPSVFAILGPSGTGKSSFLRAGLLPRLARDDRRFAVLDIVRPERAALTGARGLAAAIHGTRTRLGLSGPSLGDIKSALPHRVDLVRQWLREITRAAHDRLIDPAAAQPTPVLPIDQAEELFGADAGVEGGQLLDILARVLTDSDPAPLLVALTVRTDRYELFQTAPQFADIDTLVFDHLKPLPRTRFREVITGPAARATAAGHRLEIEPALLDQLLVDCTDGADTLPLLALTLSRLYQDYGDDGMLTLDEYVAMGAMNRVVRTEIDNQLSGDPTERRTQLKLLRSAFIPWLATINPENDQPLRRIARWSDLPADSRPLVDLLVEARLLVKDHRNGETVVEVATESLLRQWDELAGWLRHRAEELKDADALEQSARSWERNEHDEAWLLEGTRLVEAESLVTEPGFRERLEPVRAYITASRARENERAEAEKRRQHKELHVAKERQQAAEALAAAAARAELKAQEHAAAIRTQSRGLLVLAAVSLVITLVAVVGFVQAREARNDVRERAREGLALQLIAESKAMASGLQGGGSVLAMQLTLAALELSENERVRTAAVDLLYANPDLRWVNELEPIHTVGFSPDGTRVRAGTTGGAVHSFDARTGRDAGAPTVDAQLLTRALSPDGSRVAVWDNGFRVLDIRTGQTLYRAPDGEGWVPAATFSPDGRRIAYADQNRTIQVVDIETGVVVAEPPTDSHPALSALAFSPDGRLLAVVGGTAYVWEIDSGEVITGALVEDFTAVAFAPDGRRIATGDQDGSVRVWDITEDELTGTGIHGHTGRVDALAFGPDGTMLASGDEDGTVRAWQIVPSDDGRSSVIYKAAGPLTGHVGPVQAVGFSPDGRGIVSGGSDGTVRVWEPPLGRFRIDDPGFLERYIQAVAFSPDGSRMTAAYASGAVRVWDVRNGHAASTPLDTRVDVPDELQGSITVTLDADGSRMAMVPEDGAVYIWNVDTGTLIAGPVRVPGDRLRAVAFDSADRLVATVETGNAVQVVAVESGQVIGDPMTERARDFTTTYLSPGGSWLATADSDGRVRIWDVESGRSRGRPITPEPRLGTLAVSADGERVATGGSDGRVWIWQVETGETIAGPMSGHLGTVVNAAFSPDGKWLVTVGQDGTTRLWDAATGSARGSSRGISQFGLDSLSSVLTFHPEGKTFVTSDIEGVVREWPIFESVTTELCGRLTANMSRKTWREWVSADIEYRRLCPALPIAPDGP
ncbi:TIR domain-containing protein [Nocardia otitidiscaviarum]|uniref:TIR domain-containing protein n=1 Tax=Nocardia otitidiscaviarum TaxID=1823 RepID=A0A516NFM2_9NOCA|nr:TIR domain-containing protein [Nocardia otitidiscaviarum]MCP9623035.1 TIR domain-containing protein [Nocardia otitidiscaviarum]QDP77704.1 TIR domain-containing protein [Nocardia otitidiscaviarum]